MKRCGGVIRRSKSTRSGRGLTSSTLSLLGKVFNKVPVDTVLNRAIDALPIEFHIPGYNWCGPGTKVQKRLARGDQGKKK